MIEEPYRWVEAIANRREYIEQQISGGSPIAGVSYGEGLLLCTVSRERQKIFEIYNRIGMGAIGHPGDIERLRMAAIELASTEGFVRSVDDVSLRRLVDYSLSPMLKAAFEQVYGPPYLARMLFAEVGADSGEDYFLRLDFDGSTRTNGGGLGRAFEQFGVISGSGPSSLWMENFLRAHPTGTYSLEDALAVAIRAWALGHWALGREEQTPTELELDEYQSEQLLQSKVEVVILERRRAMTWRALSDPDVRALLVAR